MADSDYGIHVTLINETKGYVFLEWSERIDVYDLTENGTPDMGHIYRSFQREFGRCQSSTYIDTDEGPKRIGWYFVSRQKYEDGTNDTYLQGAWVSVYKVVEPAHVARVEQRAYVEVGKGTA
jgi:hypothetical protein